MAGWPGVKDVCAILETQGAEILLPGYPTGKIGDGREQKSSLNIKVLGGISRRCPGGYPGGRPDPKIVIPLLGVQDFFFCADVHDPKARTSMTRGGLRKTLCRKISG